MRKLERFDVMDYVQCEVKRAELKRTLPKLKRPRRIFLGNKLLFLFENTEIIRAHVLENIGQEKLFSERDLLRQIEVFNPLIAEQGELRCTMIILNDIEWERAKRIRLWKELVPHIYLILNQGRKIFAEAPWIPVANQHPCSMRVLKFDCGNQFPIKIGSNYSADPEYQGEEKLSTAQQKALREDLHITSSEEDTRYVRKAV
ncbi:MAG: DUF3501 family protein [Bdellovibrio sp.]|nr:DUF3501 family protein [Bdellovibrio sp.]